MKRLLIIICLTFFITQAKGQAFYLDPATALVMIVERQSTEKAKNGYVNTNKEVRKLAIPALLENASRAKLPIVAQQVFPLTYINVCSDYRWNPLLSRQKKLCDRKYAFLRDSERLIREFVNSGTRWRINRGVRSQIMEEYTDIMNKIEYELELMKIEKDKRSLARTIFN
jgi:hypothetical protein